MKGMSLNIRDDIKYAKICDCYFCAKKDVCKYMDAFMSFALIVENIPDYMYFEKNCKHFLKRREELTITSGTIDSRIISI